ncbi:MAG TPA: divalent metal cation transporter [Streptosporangiaceae bacterium]|nr:divalent metal cation transporter [Streptosporangiaceae bacterium]
MTGGREWPRPGPVTSSNLGGNPDKENAGARQPDAPGTGGPPRRDAGQSGPAPGAGGRPDAGLPGPAGAGGHGTGGPDGIQPPAGQPGAGAAGAGSRGAGAHGRPGGDAGQPAGGEPAGGEPAAGRPAPDETSHGRTGQPGQRLSGEQAAKSPARAAKPPSLSEPAARTAVLDEAHLGDIEGALGRIRVGDEQRGTWRRRLITFLAIVGPGLIVMVGDNDAGGVSTYAQAGQDYGYSLLWTLLLLIPVLIVNQEMVVRLGAVTGVGHARLINERFGRFWGWFSVGDLFLLNFLTIVTEFIGVSLALRYFGISPYISVPVAGLLLIGITASGSFRRWEQAMFAFIAVSLVMFPMALLSGPHWGAIGYHFVVPGVQGGVSSNAVLLIIAIVGTTVAPWQLFFQQSNVVDKRITPRFIRYERADTTFGAFVVIIGATAILITAVFAVRGTHLAGQFTSALGVADALGSHSRVLGALFAVVLLDASIIGAAAVTLSTSYAFGDVFGLRHSLHRSFKDARAFYASYTGIVVLAAGIVLIPGAPLGLITTEVQALAGVLLPSASVFLLLLCNDREVLGPWMNPRWLNVVAGFIIGVLLMLSGTLVVTAAFPSANAPLVAIVISAVLAVGAAAAGGWLRLTRSRRPPPAPHPRATMSEAERLNWRMPPLALLKPVEWSPVTKLAVLMLRGYLVVAVVLMAINAVQIVRGG